MWQQYQVVRQRYLSIVALGFAVVPVAGFGVALWLGRPENLTLLDSWTGRILALFFIAWWSAAFAHFRHILALLAPSEKGEGIMPGVASQGLARLHSHYWRWVFGYVVIAAVLYTAEENPLPTAPVLSLEWAQIALIQLLVAVLVGMPFYLWGLTALGGITAMTGLEKVQFSLERKLLLVGVLVPLLAGIALMYFYWWRTQLWTPEVLLVWSGLGLSVLAAVTFGVRISILRCGHCKV